MEIAGNNGPLESVFRWFHVVAGITWIGHLYFFNWVNGHFAATLDGDTKKKVVPELMPRALFFFRWGAAITWLTGVLLMGMVYYMHPTQIFGPDIVWTNGAKAMIAVTFLGFIIYDILAKTLLKDPVMGFWGGWILSSALILLYHHVGGFQYRATAIHLGALFGTNMAFNVWFRIWPAQQTIITGIKDGTPVDAAIAPMAGLRSKHNTFMSVPLVFMMIGQHATWAAMGDSPASWGLNDLYLPLVVLVGFGVTQHIYGISKNVKGF
jgi:uncharacterized membrane protein